MRNQFLLLLLACTTMHPALAQQGRPTRVPVTVALADLSARGGAPFRILRRAHMAPQDLILLAPGADASALSEAVAQLQTMRRVQGDTAAATGAMRVRRPGKGRGPRMLPWAPRVLQDLRRAAVRPVAGVGTVPSVEVWLPATRRAQIET